MILDGKKSFFKRLKKIPFLKILVPLIMGIMTGWYCPASKHYQFLFLITGLGLIIIVFFLSSKWTYFLGLISYGGLALLFLAIGIQLIEQEDIRNTKNWYGNYLSENTRLTIEITSIPERKEKSIKIRGLVQLVGKNRKLIATKGGLLMYLTISNSSLALRKGNKICFSKSPELIKNDGNPGEFNQQRFWLAQQITHRVFLSPTDWYKLVDTEKDKSYVNKITNQIDQLQVSILETLRKYIPDKSVQGFAEALLIGYKNDLDKKTNQLYANMGVIHIIAISGLHVGLIFWMLQLLTRPFARDKKSKLIITVINLVGLWVFGILTGGSPSVLRSILLFTCIEIGQLINRNASSLNSIAVSAFLLLCVNPFFLWDLGFQLSYLAVLSIILYYDSINRLVEFKWSLLNSCWNSIAITVSAQILTTPITIYWFHQFPTYFLLSNFIAVPLSGFILFVEILILCLQAWGTIAVMLGELTIASISWMNSCIEWLSKLPYALIENLRIDLFFLIGIYAAIAALSFWWMLNFSLAKYASILLVGNLLVLHLLLQLQLANQQQLIIYRFSNNSAIEIINGQQAILYADASTVSNSYNLSIINNSHHYFHVNHMQVITLDSINYSLRFKTKELLWIRSNKLLAGAAKNADWIVLSGKAPISLANRINPKPSGIIIIDKSVKSWAKPKWIMACREKMLKCYCIDNNGAFVSSLP